MAEFHGRLGEGLFVIFLVVMGIVWFLGRSGREVPGVLTGIAHGLLALQVALGLILLIEEPDRIGSDGAVPWYHPLLGIAAMLAIGLTPALKRRLGDRTGLVVTLGLIALLAFAAWLAAN
jgi:hypothetical protein